MTEEHLEENTEAVLMGTGKCTYGSCTCTQYEAPGTSRGGCKNCTHRQSWHE